MTLLFLTRPSNTIIRQFLNRQAQSCFSYRAVGDSLLELAPAGYIADHSRALLGHGERIWHNAVRAINTWEMFRMEWVQLCWPDVPITQGANVAVLARHFGFWSLNATRIVYTVNDDSSSIRKYGFAYGTLFDHSESGEERFLVEWHAHDESVWYDIFAFSRPRTTLAKLGYPLVRWLQHRFAKGSLAAMARATAHQ